MKRYLEARFDVTGLTREEVEGLWGEVLAQSESSERHSDVEAELEVVENPDACAECGRDGADHTSGLCASCAQQARHERVAEAEDTRRRYEFVTFDPDDPDTYPSVCADRGEVEARFGFVGGETLLFDERGSYQGQVIKRLNGSGGPVYVDV